MTKEDFSRTENSALVFIATQKDANAEKTRNAEN